MLDRTREREIVVGQPDPIAAREEQPATAVFGNRVAGIDVVGQSQRDGIAPRAGDCIGPGNEDIVLRAWP